MMEQIIRYVSRGTKRTIEEENGRRDRIERERERKEIVGKRREIEREIKGEEI